MDIEMNIAYDQEHFGDSKLKGYERCEFSSIKPGDHLRTTSAVYRDPENRKCNYIVVEKIVEGVAIVNSYKPIYKSWGVCEDNKYKEYLFYRKIAVPHTGSCQKCSKMVKEPYIVCYNCRS